MAIQQTEYSVTRYYHLEQARWACFVYSHGLVIIATAISCQSPNISVKCIKVTIGPKPFSLSAVMCLLDVTSACLQMVHHFMHVIADLLSLLH
jgi:hypothetical protein